MKKYSRSYNYGKRINPVSIGISLEKGDEAMRKYFDQVGVDNDQGIDVTLHVRGGHFKWNFEKTPMSIPDKITLVLTLVNVAILISLVIKNA